MKKRIKSLINKIDKRFALVIVILSLIVSGSVYAEFRPLFTSAESTSNSLPSSSYPQLSGSTSPSPTPTSSVTPSAPPATPQASTSATHTGSNNTAQCQTIINQANADLNAQYTNLQAELATYKAMISNMSSSPSQGISGSGSTQSQMMNQAGQEARLHQEDDKITQMQDQFNTSKSNYQDELIGKGCPYTIGAQNE